MIDTRPRHLRWSYTVPELWADGIVHAVGLVSAVTGAVVSTIILWGRLTPGEVVALTIYLATLLCSVAVSAAYNVWPVTPTKWLLRRFDHAAIFLLIAGTYTPFMAKMATWGLLAAVWAIAGIGVILKLGWPGRLDRLAILLYLGLGWSGFLVYDTLVATLPMLVFWLILAGGLVYSVGVAFHVLDRLRFQNAIWHAFVLIASAIHFAAVWCATAAHA